MRRSLLAGVVCCAATYASAPVVRRFLTKRGALDIPNHRSSHSSPVPRGGGLACGAGLALGLIAAGPDARVPTATLIGIAAVAGVGWADDHFGGLPPQTRLAVQAVSGALFSPSLPLAPLTCLGTAGVVNVVNFMDGINGITASTAAIWGTSTLHAGRVEHHHQLQVLGALTAGAGLGFLPWNAPVADLFLGDVGSYLFGGLMAASIASVASQPALAWRVAAPLLPYASDAAQAIVRRAKGGQSLTVAHRDHVYQQLVDLRGLSHVEAAAVHGCTSLVIGVLARRSLSFPTCLAITSAVVAYLMSPRLADRLRGERR